MKLRIVMLKSNNFSAKYRVYYEDTDAGGIVYYANYLKFFERARTDFLRHLGISQNELVKKEKLVFVVRHCELDYVRPAQLDDFLEVSVAVEKIGAASIVMNQEIKVEGQLFVSLKVEIVTVDVDGFRPRKIPAELRELLV